LRTYDDPERCASITRARYHMSPVPPRDGLTLGDQWGGTRRGLPRSTYDDIMVMSCMVETLEIRFRRNVLAQPKGARRIGRSP